MAGYFGDGQIHAEDLVSGILGAVVKDPVQDKVVWQEYMETVSRTVRAGKTSTGLQEI